MSDDIDRAQPEMEQGLAQALRLRKPVGPRYTGRCANCEAPTPPGLRWCDALCRDEWEAENVRG